MKKKFAFLLLSLLMVAGSGQMYADRNDGRGGKDRQEQHGQHRGNSANRNNGNRNNSKIKNDKKGFDRPGGNKYHGNMNQGHPGGNKTVINRPGGNRPVPGHVNRPVGPAHVPVVRPGGGFHFGPALPPPPPRLPYMVEYVTRGCHDVNVWQIDSETFIVKFRRGGRWYTQYVYPYAQRYGHPTLISVNWQPMTPWTFIPPIQLNINL